MASDEDIKSFIEQQREAGAFDSSGHFSVDLRKARAKSTLGHGDVAGAHCLYWVQGWAWDKAPTLSMTFDSLRVSADERLGWEALRRIAWGEEDLEPRFRPVRRAIRAAASLSDHPRLVYWDIKQGAFQMSLSDGKVEAYTPKGGATRYLGVDFPRTGTAAERAEELRVVQSRCGFAPSHPRYENRSLTEENPDGFRGRPACATLWNTYTHPSYLLALRVMAGPKDQTGFLVRDEFGMPSQLPIEQPDHSIFLLKRDSGCMGRADRVIGIPLGLDGPGFVRLISHGVILESFEYDLGVPGAWAQVCVDPLETDLSGLKLVRNEKLESVLQHVRQQTQELAKEALSKIDRFKLPTPPAETQPGLLVRLMVWAFAPKDAQASSDSPEARARDCREEVRRRLAIL